MKHRLAVLLALPLAACAAHNHHRVPIEMNQDLAPLIDEAWANMEKGFGGAVPLGATPVVVQVEDVDVQWLPWSAEVPPGGTTMPESEMKKAIEDVLWPPEAPKVENPPRYVRVALAVDLNEPNALEMQVHCALVDALADGVVASGGSTIVRFERLYCHGCRERWGGHGTELGGPLPGGDGDGFYGGVGVGVSFSSPGCSAGYIKN